MRKLRRSQTWWCRDSVANGLCFSRPSDMELTWELVRQAESQGPLELLSPHFHLNKICEWYVHTLNLGSIGFVFPGWRPLTLHRSLSCQLHTFSTIPHHQPSVHPAHARTPLPISMLCSAVFSLPVMSDSLRHYGPPGSSVHGDSPGKNTGVGCHALLQGIFPTQGIEPRSPTLQGDSLHEPPWKSWEGQIEPCAIFVW